MANICENRITINGPYAEMLKLVEDIENEKVWLGGIDDEIEVCNGGNTAPPYEKGEVFIYSQSKWSYGTTDIEELFEKNPHWDIDVYFMEMSSDGTFGRYHNGVENSWTLDEVGRNPEKFGKICEDIYFDLGMGEELDIYEEDDDDDN